MPWNALCSQSSNSWRPYLSLKGVYYLTQLLVLFLKQDLIVGQGGLELTEISPPHLPRAEIKDLHYHAWLRAVILYIY